MVKNYHLAHYTERVTDERGGGVWLLLQRDNRVDFRGEEMLGGLFLIFIHLSLQTKTEGKLISQKITSML